MGWGSTEKNSFSAPAPEIQVPENATHEELLGAFWDISKRLLYNCKWIFFVAFVITSAASIIFLSLLILDDNGSVKNDIRTLKNDTGTIELEIQMLYSSLQLVDTERLDELSTEIIELNDEVQALNGTISNLELYESQIEMEYEELDATVSSMSATASDYQEQIKEYYSFGVNVYWKREESLNTDADTSIDSFFHDESIACTGSIGSSCETLFGSVDLLSPTKIYFTGKTVSTGMNYAMLTGTYESSDWQGSDEKETVHVVSASNTEVYEYVRLESYWIHTMPW